MQTFDHAMKAPLCYNEGLPRGHSSSSFRASDNTTSSTQRGGHDVGRTRRNNVRFGSLARTPQRRRNVAPVASSSPSVLFVLLLAFVVVGGGGGGVTGIPTAAVLTGSTTAAAASFMGSAARASMMIPSTGPIDDATCNIEDLEQANDAQLYTILQDLKRTSIFRHFAVDLETKCPLRSWRQQTTEDDDDDDSKKSRREGEEEEGTTTAAAEDDDDDVFECSGGKDELDEDAEPLCTVQLDDGDPFGGGGDTSMSTAPMDSNALRSLSDTGFESKAQQKTFAWKKHVDKVVVEDKEGDDGILSSCDNDELPPDTFWMDICQNLQTTESAKNVVNLELNPEHNTGYNGTHIWRAIYEENCILQTPQISTRQTPADASSSSLFPTASANDGEKCLEERVLYRLLSGLHASTTVSIAMKYYPPSKRKNRPDWQANPAYFYGKFGSEPEHVRNMHFSYLVLLRALRKASPFLYSYEMHTGDIVQDETASVLLKRLLDSAILQSCSSVFDAFDESLMFQDEEDDDDNGDPTKGKKSRSTSAVSLRQNFKGVFHNISSILDCVQCQQCKLHGKMAMLGYGTALKVLFSKSTSNAPLQLDRNEVVAMIQTIAKFSESIRHVRELTQMYWEELQQQQQQSLQEPSIAPPAQQQQLPSLVHQQSTTLPGASTPTVPATASSSFSYASPDLVDGAVGLIASLGRQGLITGEQEGRLVQLALHRNSELLILVRHYGQDPHKFVQFLPSLLSLPTTIAAAGAAIQAQQPEQQHYDAIVVGSGLAGLAATLNILDRGGRVLLLEKEHLLGGNSNKASSGINGCCLPHETNVTGDALDLFRNDTTKSAAASARPDLIETLVNNSASAVTWLQSRTGVDLSLLARLGGHRAARTHRPKNGMVGAEIIYAMQKAVRAHQKSSTSAGKVQILTDTAVTKLVTNEDGEVLGVEYTSTKSNKKSQKDKGNDNTEGKTAAPQTQTAFAKSVVLATGGFAADRSAGSYLAQYRPELLRMPATAGEFSKGDGITLASAAGAGRVDMEHVQLHPTGWVDPADPNSTSKILAAELMRGVGGILLNDKGERFCNELGTRAYVTDQMLKHDAEYAATGKWNVAADNVAFSLVLPSAAAANAGKKHVDLYSHKGLLTKLNGIGELAEWMGLGSKKGKKQLVTTMQKYQQAAGKGRDEFGKTTFPNVPTNNTSIKDWEREVFYAGTVTPVLHYCMGGITIDTSGRVLREGSERDGGGSSSVVIPNLYAAGEVTGGVHGVNRLGGNSLLECTVFGTIVGNGVPIIRQQDVPLTTATTGAATGTAAVSSSTGKKGNEELWPVSLEELSRHDTPEDCWVAIHGIVYDLTEFADEHPAGPQSIYDLAGTDGTAAFDAVHNTGMLDDEFDENERVGRLVLADAVSDSESNSNDNMEEDSNATEKEETRNTSSTTPAARRTNTRTVASAAPRI